jgi:hypothetical protein
MWSVSKSGLRTVFIWHLEKTLKFNKNEYKYGLRLNSIMNEICLEKLSRSSFDKTRNNATPSGRYQSRPSRSSLLLESFISFGLSRVVTIGKGKSFETCRFCMAKPRDKSNFGIDRWIRLERDEASGVMNTSVAPNSSCQRSHHRCRTLST